jgi:hypothetical protein
MVTGFFQNMTTKINALLRRKKDVSKIINPMRRKVGRIEIDIFDDNQTQMLGINYGPLGQQGPMLPLAAATVLTQIAAGTLVGINNAMFIAQQNGNKGSDSNGKGDQTGKAEGETGSPIV